MTIVLICLAVSVVAYAVTAILNKLGKRWSLLPHFVRTYVGGVLAICSITDFKKAVQKGSIINLTGKERKLIRVPETITFANSTITSTTQGFSGTIEWLERTPWAGKGSFRTAKEVPDLFVPFASERYIPFSEQEKLFIVSQDPVEFEEKKREQNFKSDFRLRFAAWGQKWDISEWKAWSFIALIAISLIFLFVGVNALDKNSNEREVVIRLTTRNGKVQEIKTTKKEARRLLVQKDLNDDKIIKGRVLKLQYLGGGNSRVCVQRANGSRLDCGFADSSLYVKEGDEAYLRTAKLLWWTIGETAYNQTDDGWLITKAEAENLVATGKFQIVE